jgi:hypothetical protein
MQKIINTTCTLGTSWTLDSTTGYYTQNVSIEDVTAEDQPSLSLVKNGTTASNDLALEQQWALIAKAETYDGGITFYATSATAVTLTVKVSNGITTGGGSNTDSSAGTTDYSQLTNKPKINGTELVGDLSITSVSGDAANIATNKTNIETNTKEIETLKTSISTKAESSDLDAIRESITANTTQINSNAKNIETNTTNIATNKTSIESIKTDISNKANQSDLDTLSSTVKTNTKSIETNTSDIATNKASIETNATNIATNTKNISSNTSDISTLKTTVSTKANQSDLDTTNKNVATNTSAIATETTARESADTTLQANIDTLSSKVDTKQDTLISGTNIKTINNQSLLGSGDITIEGGSGSTEPFFLYKYYYKSDYSEDTDIPSGYINWYQKDNKTYVKISEHDSLSGLEFEISKPAGHAYGFKNLPSLDDCSAFDIYVVYTNMEVAGTTINIIDSTKTPFNLYCVAYKSDFGNFWIAMEMNPSSPPRLKQDTLVSGTNIKTINNQSLLGSGNITIEGGATNTVVYETVNTLSALPSTGNLNTLYYVEDIKGYYIYTGEVYRSIDATAVQNNLNTLETTVKGKQDKFTIHDSQSIEITSWELLSDVPSWCTDDPYMYRAKVSISDITENTMIMNIVLSDSILLNIGQVIETTDGGIYLYAKSNTALSGTLITLITCEVQNA